MDCIQAIWEHPRYVSWYQRLLKAEQGRVYCCHDIVHLLDVARIAYIINLEEGRGFTKELIYASAILHDIGKAAQYEVGTPHEIVGAEIALDILRDVNAQSSHPYFTEDDIASIAQAIKEHRRCPEGSSELGKLLYQADKASRACYACTAREGCSWAPEKKNMSITI